MGETFTKRAAGRWHNLAAAISAIAICDIAFGLAIPLIAILLENRGVSASIIGANAAMAPLGILLAGPFIPQTMARAGAHQLALLTIPVMAFLFLGFKVFPSLFAWFVLRFAFGVVAGTLYSMSEAWIVHFSEGPRRGRIIGLYTSVVSITFSVGPLIIPYIDINGWTPWLIGVAMVSIAGIPLLFLRLELDFASDSPGGFLQFLRRAPLLLFSVTTLTIFDAVMLAFFIIYGLRNGLDVKHASLALGVSIAGNAILQIPIGMLADRWSPVLIMWFAAILSIAMAGALPFIMTSILLWPVVFLMGTAAYAVYTAALSILGESFKGADLVAGTSAFAAMWGVGGIVGPPLVGAALDTFGIHSFPLCIVAVYACLLILLVASGGKLVRATA